MIIKTCEVYLAGPPNEPLKGCGGNRGGAVGHRRRSDGEQSYYYTSGCDVESDCDRCPFTDCKAALIGGRMIVAPSFKALLKER